MHVCIEAPCKIEIYKNSKGFAYSGTHSNRRLGVITEQGHHDYRSTFSSLGECCGDGQNKSARTRGDRHRG